MTRGLSSECSDVARVSVTSSRFVVSCVVSVACLVGLLGWVDAASSALLSTETAPDMRTTQEWRNPGAFAALKTDGSVITWGSPDFGGVSTGVATSLSSGVAHIFSTEMAFAALKTDGSVITWGNQDYGGNSTSVATSLSSGVTRIFSAQYA